MQLLAGIYYTTLHREVICISAGVAYNKYSPEFVLPNTYYIYNL